MKTAARERILDLALTEFFGAEAPPDLTMRVVTAARTGSGRPRRRSGHRRMLALAAAVLLVMVGGLTGWLLLRPAPPAPPEGPRVLARAAEPFRVIEPSLTTRNGTALHDGEFILVPGPGNHTVTLEGGAGMEIFAGSLVGFELRDGRPVGRLLRGRVGLRNEGRETIAFLIRGREVEVAPGTVLEIETLDAAPLTPEAFAATATHWITGRAPLPGPVLVSATRGSVACGELSIGTGELLCLSAAAAPVRAALPPAADRIELRNLLASIRTSETDLDLNDPADRDIVKETYQSFSTLSRRIRDVPDQRGFIVAVLAHLPREPNRPDVRKRVVTMLALDPDLAARELLTESLALEPYAFEIDSLLALAEHGVEQPVEWLRTRLEEGKVERRLTGAAVYLAFRGSGDGRVMLAFANALDLEPWNSTYRFAAAAGYHLLGKEDSWKEAVRAATTQAETWLLAGQVKQARQLALRALYFHRAVSTGEPVRLSDLDERLARFETERGTAFETPEQIRSLLRSMVD